MPVEPCKSDITVTQKSSQAIYQILCALLSSQGEKIAWGDRSDLDWESLAEKARSEGVAPLLYWKVRGLKPAGTAGTALEASPASLEKLKSEYYNTAANNGVLYEELTRILEVLAHDQIPVIVLKGAALAADLYADPALRPMGDLDLLIREEDLERAIPRVEGLGYRLEGALRGLNPDLRRRIHSEVNFQGGQQIPVHLEIHWSLIGGRESHYRPEIEWFWAQTDPWNAPGKRGIANVFALKPTAHLLYLMAHLVLKHGEGQDSLRWYYDLHLLIERRGEQIEWQTLLRQAKAFHWEAALGPALSGIVERFGSAVPAEVLAAVPGSAIPSAGANLPKTDVEKTLAELADLSWATRMRLVLALIFPSRERMLWRYQPKAGWTWPLYYPYRWVGILKAGVVHISRKLSQKVRRSF